MSHCWMPHLACLANVWSLHWSQYHWMKMIAPESSCKLWVVWVQFLWSTKCVSNFFFILSNTVNLLPSTSYIIPLQFKSMCALVHKCNSVIYAFFTLHFKAKFLSIIPIAPTFSSRLNTYNYVWNILTLINLYNAMWSRNYLFFSRCGNDEERFIQFNFINEVFLMHDS